MNIIRRNIRDCGFENHAKETCIDYTMCVKMIEKDPRKPDLVFLDPPYHKGMAEDALGLLAPILQEGALVAVETASDETFPFAGLALRKEYRQGSVKITLLEKRRNEA
jgi:16S rRNA G966 N2-methylase RsmD